MKQNSKSALSRQIQWDDSDFEVSVTDRSHKNQHQTVNNHHYQLFNLYQTSKQQNNTNSKHSIDQYLNSYQRKDSHLELFGTEQELLELSNDIMSKRQFGELLELDKNNDLGDNIRIKNAQGNIFDGKDKNLSSGRWTPYYTEYLKWKNAKQANILPIQLKRVNDDISVTDILLEKQLRKQQWNQLKHKQQQKIKEKRVRILKRNLEEISSDYQQKMNELLRKKTFTDEKRNHEREMREKKLNMVKIDEVVLRKQSQHAKEQSESGLVQQKKLNVVPDTTYIDLIRHPPKIIKGQSSKDLNQISSSRIQRASKLPQSNYDDDQSLFQETKKTERNWLWKLDIDMILKMPHKKFLLFFNQNQRKLVALSTPQQLTKLNNYRQQALDRQSALQKLRQKVSKNGKQILSRLSPQKKEKLFRVLYEEQLEEEVNCISQQIENI